jgi:hypothetical protein
MISTAQRPGKAGSAGPVTVDFSRESFPYLFYRRINVLRGTEYITFALDYGFNYLVKRIAVKWDGQNIFPVGAYLSPDVLAELLRYSCIAGQNVPFALPLVTSPASSGVSFIPSAVVATSPMQAVPRKAHKAVNLLYAFKDVLYIRLSGMNVVSSVNPELNHPSYIDLLVEGRYFPETSESLWI